MERPLTLKPLSIQDENSAFHRKKAGADGKSKGSKPVAKKGGAALGSRRALNDITNKSSIHRDASSQKTDSQNKKCNVAEDGLLHHRVSEAGATQKQKGSTDEKLDIAEEGFLHDHSKCIEGQKAALELNFWDTVFPGHGETLEQEKSDPDIVSMRCFPELEEILVPELSDWYKSCRKSPPTSPTRWNSQPPSPFAWDLEPFEITLKEA